MPALLASDPAVTESATVVDPASPPKHPIRRLLDDRVVLPLLHLLRIGASPRRLAWSLAVGVVIGINPIVGSTTVLCLLIAFIIRLNQIANHLCFPIQLALVLVYLNAGEKLFRTGPLPIAADAYLHDLRHHPWSTAHLLWTWEWHAIIVWLLVAAILTPTVAAILHPILNRLLLRLHHDPEAH